MWERRRVCNGTCRPNAARKLLYSRANTDEYSPIREGRCSTKTGEGINEDRTRPNFSFAAASFAQDPKANPVKEPDIRSSTGEVKRLGSVTWDLEAHKLVWVVQKGAMVNGEFVPASEQKYEISPDKARMMVAEEERGFDGDEAVSLHHLLDVLSLYCAESVVWWDEGQGTPASKQPTNRQEKPKTDKSDRSR